MDSIFNGNAKPKCPSSTNSARFRCRARDMIIPMIRTFWPGHADWSIQLIEPAWIRKSQVTRDRTMDTQAMGGMTGNRIKTTMNSILAPLFAFWSLCSFCTKPSSNRTKILTAVSHLQIPILFPPLVPLPHHHMTLHSHLPITRVVSAPARIMADGIGDHLALGSVLVHFLIRRLNNVIMDTLDTETAHAHHHHEARHVQVARPGRVRHPVSVARQDDNFWNWKNTAFTWTHYFCYFSTNSSFHSRSAEVFDFDNKANKQLYAKICDFLVQSLKIWDLPLKFPLESLIFKLEVKVVYFDFRNRNLLLTVKKPTLNLFNEN